MVSMPGIEEYQRVHQTIVEALVGPHGSANEIPNARDQLEAAVALITTFADPNKVTDLASLPDALADDTPEPLRALAERVAAYKSDAVKPPYEVIEALRISGRPQDNDFMSILSERAMKVGTRLKTYTTLAPEPR